MSRSRWPQQMNENLFEALNLSAHLSFFNIFDIFRQEEPMRCLYFVCGFHAAFVFNSFFVIWFESNT